jgi:hypothetical protein
VAWRAFDLYWEYLQIQVRQWWFYSILGLLGAGLFFFAIAWGVRWLEQMKTQVWAAVLGNSCCLPPSPLALNRCLWPQAVHRDKVDFMRGLREN